MDGFAFLTPSPQRVHHRAAAMLGFRAFWFREIYKGGPHWTEHFRICNYCRGLHPADVLELLDNHGAYVSETTKPGKWLVHIQNPIAGGVATIGSTPGAVFDKAHWPSNLVGKLYEDTAKLPFEPTIGERLTGHFEHPATHPAPDEFTVPLYGIHVHDRQWPVISEAAKMEIHR